MEIKFAIAMAAGFSSILCTTILKHKDHEEAPETSTIELHILEKFGWIKIHEFLNKRSGNTIGVFWKDLEPEE